MSRTARIFWIHARIGLLAELQYRTDVWARLLSTVILTGASLASIAIVYSNVDEVAGWTRSDLVVVIGTFLVLGALVNGIIHVSMAELARDIKQGTLDFRLLKPVDAQALALVQKVDPWRGFDVLLGTGLCAWGMSTGGRIGSIGDGAASIAGGLVLLVAGAVMLAGFWLLVTCVAFWTIQGEGILWALDDMYDHMRWPITMFAPGLRLALMTAFPAGLAITAPAQALTGRLDASLLLVTGCTSLAFLLAARVTWLRALRRYEGASG
jgi:ABC-2 type transport system permease protein